MASRANNRVQSTASESLYTGLVYSDGDMYSTVTPAPIKNRGAKRTEGVCTDCPRNWLQFNSKYYYISDNQQTWSNSRSDCQKRGGDLVIINSSLEQIFIWSHTGGNYWDQYWIGLTDAKREGIWLWVDDTQLTGGYWMDGQPDNFNRSENCAATFTTVNALKSWNDVECQSSMRWICEANTLPPSP
ncbi:CLC4E protein, partial [Atractosteus spatula]|nr:CLC4E protein [Atractosteus spatula]